MSTPFKFASIVLASSVAAAVPPLAHAQTRAAAAPAETLAVVDALYRFAQGMDEDNPQLLRSAFAADAVADFSPAAKRLGIEFPVLRGRETIAGGLIPFAAPLDTSHSVSNPRVQIKGRTATLSALVEAQHLPSKDHSRHILMKNRYAVDLVRAGSSWVITKMVIDNIWFDGDVKVLSGQ
jgi:SnoaL-like domain